MSAAAGASGMLVCFTFRCKPGREAEFEALMRNPEAGRLVAARQGAARNTLFLAGGRMVRVMEFPEGVTPRTMWQVAQEEPAVAAFLRRLGPLAEDGFDGDDADSLARFTARAMVPMAYDVRP